MDLSKIESGLAILTKDIFNYSEMVQKIVDSFKEVYANKNCEFKLDIPKELYVNADKTKIERVLYNLISNAINHSGENGENKVIKIKITTYSKNIKTEVIDNGIGIKKEDLAHIWHRYYKANKNYKRSDSGGSGLGLSIVKEILIAHKSNYGVKSKENEGANFWFDLDRANKPKIITEKEKTKLKNDEKKE